VLETLGVDDPILAKLEALALEDEYFKSRAISQCRLLLESFIEL
jgi:hypothetical protein